MPFHNRIPTFVILAILLFTGIAGCGRTLSVRVHDSLTLLPVANAAIDGHPYSGLFFYAGPHAEVDDQGNASLDWPNAAFERLTISAPGYLPAEINPTAQNFRDGISIGLNPKLNPGKP